MHASWLKLATALCALSAGVCGQPAQPIHLTSPRDGVQAHSAYIAVEGEAAPSAAVEIFDGNALAASLHTDAAGRFERILRLASGHHQLRAKSGGSEAAARVDVGAHAAPPSAAPYEWLQTGDVILAHDRNSQQDALYRPVYTHAALYMGPAADGAPLLLEAVSEDNATSFGPVAAVPFESSIAFREADRVEAFRLAAGLSNGDRTRIVTWARATAARGLPFRATGDFGDIYRAWLLWDPKTDSPRDAAEFERMLDALRERLTATDSYDCATLVWRAYRDNTAAHIDLATPNRIALGGAIESESKRLVALLRPLLILPDSFALSGKLRRVTGE
jgi:hypothetical protein